MIGRRRVAAAALASTPLALAACAAIAGLGEEPTTEIDAADGGGDATSLDAADASDGRTGSCASGALDPTFADGGVGVYPLTTTGNHDEVHRLLVLGGGDILLGTTSYDQGGNPTPRVVKLAADGGMPDPSFGDGGSALFLPSADAGPIPDTQGLVADFSGRAYFGAGFALARLTAQGTLDPTFGAAGDGVLRSSFTGEGAAAVDDSHDRIVESGWTTAPPGFRVVRFTSAFGVVSVDTSFGQNGSSFVPVGGDASVPRDFALATNGDPPAILLGGFETSVGPAILLRLDAFGGLDQGFGSAGVLRLEQAVEILDAAFDKRTLDDAGSPTMVVAGYSGTKVNAPYLARVSYDGQNVQPFDATKLPAALSEIYWTSVTIDSAGRTLVAGAAVYTPTVYQVVVARYLPDGTLDATFGDGGAVMTTVHGNDDPHGIAVDRDGRIVVAIQARGGGDPGTLAVARYCP